MKRIVAISDTHIPKAAEDLPKKVYEELQKADLILHAGDFVELEVLKNLQNIAPIHAVRGNMDMDEVKAALPEKDVIEVKGFKIGLIHGYGAPAHIVEIVSKAFKNMDVIVFGHSHSALSRQIGKTLLFNPGSPTDKVFAAYNSFGILEVGEEIKARIIKL